VKPWPTVPLKDVLRRSEETIELQPDAEDRFLSLQISLHPLPEQRRNVARIEELAAQIHEASTLRGEGKNDLNALLAATHREIAASAPRRPLAEVVPFNRRPVSVDLDTIYPTVAVRSFGRGTFHRAPLIGSEVTWEKLFLVKAGDILVSNIKDPEGLHEVGEASPGSADRNRTLSEKGLMRIPVPVPSYAEQTRFDALCREVDALKRLQTETAAELEALLPAIVDRTFKGEL
jgi:type I restriction enzyme S subunit